MSANKKNKGAEARKNAEAQKAKKKLIRDKKKVEQPAGKVKKGPSAIKNGKKK